MKTGNTFILMHKDIPVCVMDISEEGELGNIHRENNNSSHFPIGGQLNDMKFYEWWKDRAIPKTRNNAANALRKLGYSSTSSALVNNLALSLNDCYWIKPRGSDLTWKDVSLFTNDFVDRFGELTINTDSTVDLRKDTRFNCASSSGELQKKWCIDNKGQRYLIKGNYGNSYQQSLNEIFACSLHKQQGFKNYTEYSLVKITTANNQEGLGCLSYDFCNENIEEISDWELLQTRKIRKNEPLYYPLKEVCMELGMSEAHFDNFMDYEILTDYLISNTDRHMNNISVLRNPDTLEIIGFAPIYDSGNSMFYNIDYGNLDKIKFQEIRTHSFVEKEIRLLKYVTDRNIVDLDKVDPDFSIYEKDIPEQHIRIEKTKELFEKKLNSLREFQRGKDIWKRRN